MTIKPTAEQLHQAQEIMDKTGPLDWEGTLGVVATALAEAFERGHQSRDVEVSALQDELARNKFDVESHAAIESSLEQRLASCRQDNSELTDHIKTLRKSRDAASAFIGDLESKLKIAQEECDRLRGKELHNER